jgi:hypothetical protein
MVAVEVIEFVEFVEVVELAELVELKPETGTGADSETGFQYIFGWEEVGEGCGEYEEE